MSYQTKALIKNHWQQVRETTCSISFILPGAEEKLVILSMILNVTPVTTISTQHAFYKSFDDFFP
jgi:hypothetical protein